MHTEITVKYLETNIKMYLIYNIMYVAYVNFGQVIYHPIDSKHLHIFVQILLFKDKIQHK